MRIMQQNRWAKITSTPPPPLDPILNLEYRIERLIQHRDQLVDTGTQEIQPGLYHGDLRDDIAELREDLTLEQMRTSLEDGLFDWMNNNDDEDDGFEVTETVYEADGEEEDSVPGEEKSVLDEEEFVVEEVVEEDEEFVVEEVVVEEEKEEFVVEEQGYEYGTESNTPSEIAWLNNGDSPQFSVPALTLPVISPPTLPTVNPVTQPTVNTNVSPPVTRMVLNCLLGLYWRKIC